MLPSEVMQIVKSTQKKLSSFHKKTSELSKGKRSIIVDPRHEVYVDPDQEGGVIVFGYYIDQLNDEMPDITASFSISDEAITVRYNDPDAVADKTTATVVRDFRKRVIDKINSDPKFVELLSLKSNNVFPLSVLPDTDWLYEESPRDIIQWLLRLDDESVQSLKSDASQMPDFMSAVGEYASLAQYLMLSDPSKATDALASVATKQYKELFDTDEISANRDRFPAIKRLIGEVDKKGLIDSIKAAPVEVVTGIDN